MDALEQGRCLISSGTGVEFQNPNIKQASNTQWFSETEGFFRAYSLSETEKKMNRNHSFRDKTQVKEVGNEL